MIRTALISVSDKANLVRFAQELVTDGWQIISTGGTFKVLKAEKIEAIPIEAITGVPEVMDGRIKTINHKIAGGILPKRDKPEHMADLENVIRGRPIDMVVVNLYPFAETAAKSDVTLEELIENIDIGGPSLIRAAAKNFQDVLVVTSPNQYNRVLDNMGKYGGAPRWFRFQLACEAFRHTFEYDKKIATELELWVFRGINQAATEGDLR